MGGTVRKWKMIGKQSDAILEGKMSNKQPLACLRCAGPRAMRRAGVHLQATTHLAQLIYKGIQHGEGGGVTSPTLSVNGPKQTFCDVNTVETVDIVQKALQDHPTHWVNPKLRSEPSSKAPPRPDMLEQCLVPWVVIQNPDRYPFVWGRGQLSALPLIQRTGAAKAVNGT